jgi:uncharacterized BrkB/YihY/UPF0761 family membrane protein
MAANMAISEQQALDRGDRNPRRPALLAVVAIGLGVLVLALIVATRGRFQQLIAEFEIALPFVTLVALSPLLPAILAVIVAVTVAKECWPRRRSLADVWNGSVLCLALFSAAVYVVGIFSPLMKLIEGLS